MNTKCTVCKRKKGWSCFIKTVFRYATFVVTNPKLSLWIVKNTNKPTNTETNRESTTTKISFWKKLQLLTLNNCSNYNEQWAYERWIIENEKAPKTQNINHISMVTSSIAAINIENIESKKFTVLLEPEAELSEHAINLFNHHIDKNPELPVIFYGDYDLLENNKRTTPAFNPNWNRFLFYSKDYTGPLVFVQNDFLKGVIGINATQNLIVLKQHLYITAIENNLKIEHIASILSHTKRPYSSLNTEYRNQIINRHLEKQYSGLHIDFSNSTPVFRNKIDEHSPQVSIIIPTHNNAKMLSNCLNSIFTKTEGIDFEVIVVLNNATREAEDTIRKYTYDNLRSISYNHPFNFAAINNFAASEANGQILCFLNDDTEVISKNWLIDISTLASLNNVGAVGAKLLYADNTIQHCGISLGINGIAGHSYRNKINDSSPELNLTHEVSAVTGACLCISKSKFDETKGFDEQFTSSFNDLDLCLKLMSRGYTNIICPTSILHHNEGKSRGSDFASKNQSRYLEECKLITTRWSKSLSQDPYRNKNFSTFSENFKIRIG